MAEEAKGPWEAAFEQVLAAIEMRSREAAEAWMAAARKRQAEQDPAERQRLMHQMDAMGSCCHSLNSLLSQTFALRACAKRGEVKGYWSKREVGDTPIARLVDENEMLRQELGKLL